MQLNAATNGDESRPEVELWKIGALLHRSDLRIPDYQRPYTWSTRSAGELVSDIRTFTADGDYRIGTVILHRRQDASGQTVLDVVDGQQRLTTLHLIARRLRDCAGVQLAEDPAPLPLSSFGAQQTRERVSRNAQHLDRIFSGWGPADAQAFADALLRACEVVVVILDSLDGAFQMFDSQNSRGRALYPSDLLKAFHLREIGGTAAHLAAKRELVAQWEAIPAEHINALFSDYLFRIKKWASGRPVPNREFSAEDVGMFKGIREAEAANAQNNWARAFVYAKNFTDDFMGENQTLFRFGMMQRLEYPHQIDQPVLNGENFFRMVAHYYRLGCELGLRSLRAEQPANGFGAQRPTSLDDFDERSEAVADRGRYRYVVALLDALLLYYVDRFAMQELEGFARLAAKYVMVPRAERFAVRRETIDTYARGIRGDASEGLNLFREVREAVTVRDVLQHEVTEPTLWGSGTGATRPTDRVLVARLWGTEGRSSV